MSIFKFEYKRVVLVDSADFCYAEIPLDKHAILVGKGNLGKSSILNSLRLFLLPENNFANCKKKFAFKSKSGQYSKDQSYRHYFPSNSSFLILEVENISGNYCQILYKAKSYHYSRLFVPLAYEDIRDLFWHCCDADDKDGIGRAVKGLTSASVIKKIKQRVTSSRVVSDTQTLKELLYANDLLNDTKTKYSLFPLVENTAPKVESLRTLFLLLFDMTTNSESITTAVANIIEADKKSYDDQLDFDINDFLRNHERLDEEEKQLIRIREKEPTFKGLKAKYLKYKQLSQADRDFLMFHHQLEAEKIQVSLEKQKLNLQITPLQIELKGYSTDFNRAKKSLLEKEAEIRLKKYELQKAEEDFKQGFIICQEQKSLTVDEIIEDLKEKIEQTTTRIRALNNEIVAEQRIAQLQESESQHHKEITTLNESIENQQFLLSKQLSQDSVDVLSALNKKLLVANPISVLEKDTKHTIERFTTLFKNSEDSYLWFDQKFQKRPEAFTENLAQNLLAKEGVLKEIQKELVELQQSNSSLHRQRTIEEQTKVLSEHERQLQFIEIYPASKINKSTFAEDLEGMDVDRINFESEIAISDTKHQEVDGQLVTLTTTQDELVNIQKVLFDLSKTCARLKRSYPRLEKLSSKFDNSIEKEQKIALTEAEIESIENELSDFDKLRSDVISTLKDFIYHKIIDDENSLQEDAPKQSTVHKTFTRLEEVFNDLPNKQSILDGQVETHNASVSQYTKVLEDQSQHIENFKNKLNQEFEKVSINDLDKIEVDIRIDRRFKHLVEEINKSDLYSDKPLSNRFYDKLTNFVDEFFRDQKDTRLTMERIITGLHYRTMKTGASSWQNKDQSDSTTSLINLELVQLLLSRIKKDGCHITFPLVHDELANVNLDQFDWLLPHLKEKGFNLFSAGTESTSSALLFKIKNVHDIGSMRTAHPYHKTRTRVYWGRAEEFLSTKEAQRSNIIFAEQSTLDLQEQQNNG